MKKSLKKVLCFSLLVMFSSAAYLPVLNMTMEGIAGEDGVAFAWGDKDRDKDRGKGGSHQVPEPSTLMLLGAGAAGVGIYTAIKRRKK